MKRKHAGFSLVELLVVVGIIAILAGFTIPTYQQNTTQARLSNVVRYLDSLMHDLLIQAGTNGAAPATFYGIIGAGAGGYTSYVNDNATTNLYYTSGSGWANVGAMIAVNVPAEVGRGVPGFIESTNGSDGAYNSIAIAYYEDSGTVIIYCGRWDSSNPIFIPPEFLPSGCNSDNFMDIVTGN